MPTARSRSRRALRNWLPELLALSASSPFAEGVDTGLHSARTQIFTRFFPRCGVPDVVRHVGWSTSATSGSSTTPARSPSTRSCGGASGRISRFPTVEIRICDGQPDLAESQSLAALCVALTARIARPLDEGEPIVQQPHRLIEENMWRAIRYGLSGELIDLERGDVLARPRPARAADRVGAAGRGRDRRRRVAAPSGAERRRAADRAIRARATTSPRSTATSSSAPRAWAERCGVARFGEQAREFVLHNLARRSRFGAFFVTCLRRVDGLLQ